MEQQKISFDQSRLIEYKIKALQSQMNPHFTFNAMNSIQKYIISNDIDNALIFVGEFSKLMRQTLDNSSRSLITLGEEIFYLKSYTTLENMRFDNKINVKIEYAGLDLHQVMIPPMIIQPFIENVFIHAFNKDINDPYLKISFTKVVNGLFCEIRDNGIGFMSEKKIRAITPRGIDLVKERINLINQINSESVHINSKPGKGTVVSLHFSNLR